MAAALSSRQQAESDLAGYLANVVVEALLEKEGNNPEFRKFLSGVAKHGAKYVYEHHAAEFDAALDQLAADLIHPVSHALHPAHPQHVRTKGRATADKIARSY